MSGRHAPPIDRFWRYVQKDTPEACWRWIGGKKLTGYGWFYNGSGSELAHRFAYREFLGPIPDGLEIDHVCRARDCVNPAHLRTTTHKDNLAHRLPFPYRNMGRKVGFRFSHCKRGHEFTPENVYQTIRGRECLTCKRALAIAWRAKQRKLKG